MAVDPAQDRADQRSLVPAPGDHTFAEAPYAGPHRRAPRRPELVLALTGALFDVEGARAADTDLWMSAQPHQLALVVLPVATPTSRRRRPRRLVRTGHAAIMRPLLGGT